MKGLTRVFAGEYARAACEIQDDGEPGIPQVLTPGGAYCNRLYIAGALTEVSGYGNMLRCRLSDPTGAFDLEMISNGQGGLSDQVSKIPVPSFLAVIGRAQLRKGGRTSACFVRPESVRIINRPIRDEWILRTADSTLDRIRILAAVLDGHAPDPKTGRVIDYYHTTPESLMELVALVESALSQVKNSAPEVLEPVKNSREVITGIIRDRQGARGVPVDDVILQAGLHGIGKDRAEEAIRDLIREDECYQPQKGTVRLL